MTFEIKDLAGLSEPLTKLLEVIQSACGKFYEPVHIRRMAKAQAEGHKILESAKAEAFIETGSKIESASPATILSSPGIPSDVALRAQYRLSHQEGLKQQNIEQVVAHAVSNLPKATSDLPVDADWAVRFFSIAAEISDAKMQELWGKILAGETTHPGNFSVRTIEILRNLSRDEAEIFRRVCALTFNNAFIAEVPYTQPGVLFASDSDALLQFGISFSDQMSLVDAGVLAASSGVQVNLKPIEPNEFLYQGKKVAFEIQKNEAKKRYDKDFIKVIFLSSSGSQLSTLIEPDFKLDYVKLLRDRMKPWGIDFSFTE